MIFPLAFLFFTPRLHASIELSLESNRVERGNIGYVDMEKLFEEFPETVAAKKKFKRDLQKAEDKINLEKIGILHLRQDLSDLRMERKYDIKNQSKPATAGVSVSSMAAHLSPSVSSSPVVAASTAVKTNSGAPLDPNLISALPGFGRVSASSGTSSSAYDVSAGSSAEKISYGSHVSSKAISSPSSYSASASSWAVHSSSMTGLSKTVISSSMTASSALPSNSAFAIASTHQAALSPSKMTLPQLNKKISKEKQEIAQDQAALKQDESSIEKNLLNLENRETQGLLGKIYKVIREVATESGVSVVVDKSQILYGHNAVDLTDKVLKRLKILKASGGFQ